MTAKKREIFGEFGGRHSFQRSPTRWVETDYVKSAALGHSNDVKRAGATISLLFFVRHRNVKCYAGKDFGSLDSTPSVVENVLGQLTESRGTNEDRL
jgi:hypothetical protein